MIIDADVHLSPLREYETNMNAEMLMESMEEAGVDKALTGPTSGPCCRRYSATCMNHPNGILGKSWVLAGLTQGWDRTMPGMSFTGACMSMDFMVSNLMGHRMNI